MKSRTSIGLSQGLATMSESLTSYPNSSNRRERERCPQAGSHMERLNDSFLSNSSTIDGSVA